MNLKTKEMSTIIQLLEQCKISLQRDVNKGEENALHHTHHFRHFAKIENDKKRLLIADIDFYLADNRNVDEHPITEEELENFENRNPHAIFGRQPRPEDFAQEEDYKLRLNQWQDWETWKELNKQSWP